jgi:F0F1-type ATP synthase assembly protein I
MKMTLGSVIAFCTAAGILVGTIVGYLVPCFLDSRE